MKRHAIKYTIKSLTRMANEMEYSDYMDILIYWLDCGYQDMKFVFDHMSRRETLMVIDRCVQEISSCCERSYSDLYKIAMTSLEDRL